MCKKQLKHKALEDMKVERWEKGISENANKIKKLAMEVMGELDFRTKCKVYSVSNSVSSFIL
jgi:hypothetical protein